VEAYFGDECFQMFESGDEHDLARAILALHADPERRARLVERATEVNDRYRWVHQARRYVDIVQGLITGKRAAVKPVEEPVAQEHALRAELVRKT
jgi:glycosyltransferase involved in cell wall biosynthesis